MSCRVVQKNREKTSLLRKIQQGLLLSASVAFQSKRILGMDFFAKTVWFTKEFGSRTWSNFTWLMIVDFLFLCFLLEQHPPSVPDRKSSNFLP